MITVCIGSVETSNCMYKIVRQSCVWNGMLEIAVCVYRSVRNCPSCVQNGKKKNFACVQNGERFQQIPCCRWEDETVFHTIQNHVFFI